MRRLLPLFLGSRHCGHRPQSRRTLFMAGGAAISGLVAARSRARRRLRRSPPVAERSLHLENPVLP